MPKIIAFDPTYNPKLSMIVNAFAKGCGAEVHPLGEYRECDIAIIFGLYKKAFLPTLPKKEIMEKHKGKRLLVIESAFVRRGEYWQVGWGGQAGHADFNYNGQSLDRWEKLNMEVQPWQIRNGPIVVCGQVPRDTTIQDTDHHKWCRDTVNFFRNHNIDVKFRPHPRDKRNIADYKIPPEYLDLGKLPRTLSIAKCLVTYNSTSGVDGVIAGIPVVSMNMGSFAWEVSSHELLGPYITPDRTRWLAKLGYAQWNIQEILSGQAWSHISNGVW